MILNYIWVIKCFQYLNFIVQGPMSLLRAIFTYVTIYTLIIVKLIRRARFISNLILNLECELAIFIFIRLRVWVLIFIVVQ